jgi:WD40 repeat protein
MRAAKPGFGLRSVYDVAFSPDGEWLATVGKKKAVTLWDVRQRRAVANFNPFVHPTFVAFAPDVKSVAIKDTDGAIAICRVPSGAVDCVYTPEPDEGCRVGFSPDGESLAEGSWSGRIIMRRVADLREVKAESFPQAMVVDASSSADRRLWAFAVSATHDHPKYGRAADFVTVRRWPPAGKRAVCKLGPWQRLERAQLNADGTRLAVVLGAGRLIVIDVKSPKRQKTVPIRNPVECRALAWSPDGQLLVTNQDPGYTIHRADDLSVIARVEEKYPSAAAFSPDGQWLALGSWKEGVVLPLGQLL